MEKREEFNRALKDAMKNRDQTTVSTVRLILAAMKDRDIAARGQGKSEGLGEADILSMLKSMIKQRKESAKTYREAGRDELAEQEEAEIKVIERFLPEQLDQATLDQEIEAIIKAINAQDIKDMGRVMAALKDKYAGQVDMGQASGIVKKKLS